MSYFGFEGRYDDPAEFRFILVRLLYSAVNYKIQSDSALYGTSRECEYDKEAEK